MAKISFSQKSLSNINGRPTETEKSERKYSTAHSVEEIEGQGKICNQISTGKATIKKYSTSSVEEISVKGKSFELSTGLETDELAENSASMRLGSDPRNKERLSNGNIAGKTMVETRWSTQNDLDNGNDHTNQGSRPHAKYSTCESVEENRIPGINWQRNSTHPTGPQTEQLKMNSLQAQGICSEMTISFTMLLKGGAPEDRIPEQTVRSRITETKEEAPYK